MFGYDEGNFKVIIISSTGKLLRCIYFTTTIDLVQMTSNRFC